MGNWMPQGPYWDYYTENGQVVLFLAKVAKEPHEDQNIWHVFMWVSPYSVPLSSNLEEAKALALLFL